MNAALLTYSPGELWPFINWPYLFHAWGLPSKGGNALTPQARQLQDDARAEARSWGGRVRVQALCRLMGVCSQGDDLLFDNGVTLPLLRQQERFADGRPCLCLSDFIRPAHLNQPDTIGVFAASVRGEEEVLNGGNDYQNLLAKTLCDRLVEAAVEKMHLHVRRELWGYAPDETLTIGEMLAARYRGIRPAVGYPSLPDQSANFIIDRLINMSRIGITLTGNGAMHPHASVSGLMFAHPQSRYFAVGKIQEDQLNDYASRRGLPTETMRKFLAANL